MVRTTKGRLLRKLPSTGLMLRWRSRSKWCWAIQVGLRAAFDGGDRGVLRSPCEVQGAQPETGAEFEHVGRCEVPRQPEEQLCLPCGFQAGAGHVADAAHGVVKNAAASAEIVHADHLVADQQVLSQGLDRAEFRQVLVHPQHLVGKCVNEGRMHAVPRTCLHQMFHPAADPGQLFAHRSLVRGPPAKVGSAALMTGEVFMSREQGSVDPFAKAGPRTRSP